MLSSSSDLSFNSSKPPAPSTADTSSWFAHGFLPRQQRPAENIRRDPPSPRPRRRRLSGAPAQASCRPRQELAPEGLAANAPTALLSMDYFLFQTIQGLCVLGLLP